MLRHVFQCSLSRSAKIQIKDEVQKRKQAFEQAIKDFGDSFAISTLKATEGRAQRRVFDKDIVQTIVNMALKVADKSKNDMFFDFADDEDVKAAASILAPAIFVVAGGHVSSAKYELQEMGCLRFVLRGRGRSCSSMPWPSSSTLTWPLPRAAASSLQQRIGRTTLLRKRCRSSWPRAARSTRLLLGRWTCSTCLLGGFASTRSSRQRATSAFALGQRRRIASPCSQRSGWTSVHAGRTHP